MDPSFPLLASSHSDANRRETADTEAAAEAAQFDTFTANVARRQATQQLSDIQLQMHDSQQVSSSNMLIKNVAGRPVGAILRVVQLHCSIWNLESYRNWHELTLTNWVQKKLTYLRQLFGASENVRESFQLNLGTSSDCLP